MLVGRRRIQVDWGDCDPADIVFYPRYFAWFDACTANLFATAGLPLPRLFGERGIVGIPLVDARARFMVPSAFGDWIDCESRVAEWRRSSFRIEHRFLRDGALAVEGEEVRVWAAPDPTGAKPIKAAPIPEDVIARFAGGGEAGT
jgi:4-hydroxybenzoyl-CoA thioesterase